MITETFVNACFKTLFAQSSQPKDMSTYRDILTFFDYSKKYFYEGDVPISVKIKIQLAKKTCEHMLNGGTMVEMVTSVAASEKYKQHLDLVNMFQEESFSETDMAQWQRTIQKMIAFCRLNSTFQRFDKYRDIVLNGNFDTIEDVIEEWSDMVKTASSAVADYELKTRSDLVSSFNTRADGVDSILNEIRKKYSTVNVVPSGIPELDTDFLNGGFQPSRIYFLSGTSGCGKSLVLLNSAKRAAMMIPTTPFGFQFGDCAFDDSPERVFLYVTMENYVY